MWAAVEVLAFVIDVSMLQRQVTETACECRGWPFKSMSNTSDFRRVTRQSQHVTERDDWHGQDARESLLLDFLGVFCPIAFSRTTIVSIMSSVDIPNAFAIRCARR